MILSRDDGNQGNNENKRSDSEYILKVEWRGIAERLEYKRKRGLRMTEFFGLNNWWDRESI